MRARLLFIALASWGMTPTVSAQNCAAADCNGSPTTSDLVVDGVDLSLAGCHRCDEIRVINGGRILVSAYDGIDKNNTGNLELVANSILVDATSEITARGSGYSAVRCGDGDGPTAAAGGQGGCAVRDSGGGGAHFGGGGRGTKDCFVVSPTNSCQFPDEYEEDCGNTLNGGGTACTTTTTCWNFDALPTVAGSEYWHTIWDVEFGASGADKGCRDGDGFGLQPLVAGFGGGRIALAGVNASLTGTVDIQGTVSADGKRGCGTGNDSAGGGAGGSVLIVADSVTIGSGADVSAEGGLGGDTFAAAIGQPDYQDCPPLAQTGGTCDDCGGGGGGGIVAVLSRAHAISSSATFNVPGAVGGTCTICQGEAGGGIGELQINARFTGELCDGYDNDFDGTVDEDLGTITCGLGPCAATLPACTAGEPTACDPDISGGAACMQPAVCNEPRVAVILDSSASMLQDLDGFPTFGDGSAEHPGLDTDGDTQANDSRLFLAKEALAQVISNYPEIDFSLARYHQDSALNQSCQLATWIECADIFATYDEPTDNTGPVQCTVNINPTTTVDIRRDSTGEECINYSGTCGSPRRGADVISGFGADTRDVVRWLDHEETAFSSDETEGDHCAHSAEGDCELRATGFTPLQASLEAIEDYMVPIIKTDPCTACRGYSVILVTDGVESCGGDPVPQATRLHDTLGIEVFVVAVSVLMEEEAALNALAQAGSGGVRDATFVDAPEELVPALTDVIAGSIKTETCDGEDDDCDGEIDEGFPGLGDDCDDGELGICLGTGTIECRPDESGTECNITDPGGMSDTEVCNDLDDDCDGLVDEGLICTGCVPSGPEVCDGVDNDCNGAIDEDDPFLGMDCGLDTGECEFGMYQCIGGMLQCVGGVGPRDEVCNGLDDDCDGEVDQLAPCPSSGACVDGVCRNPCASGEFPCPPGLECVTVPEVPGDFCIVTACSVCLSGEVCVEDECIDACSLVECDENETCVNGVCRNCNSLGCPSGQVCFSSQCVVDPCDAVTCASGESCFEGQCKPPCDDRECPEGQLCNASQECANDPCASVFCPLGQYCDEGMCLDDPCEEVTCPMGMVCAAEVGCIGDPCELTTCSEGRICIVRPDGSPQCVVDGQINGGDQFVFATGGGGSLCTLGGGAGSSASPLLWLAVSLILGWRRRRP